MGYFSNGTEGEMYFECYCANCIHDTNEDCPIWALHLQYNGQGFAKDASGPVITDILDQLIPRSKDRLSNQECTMFVRKAAVADLFEEAALDELRKPVDEVRE